MQMVYSIKQHTECKGVHHKAVYEMQGVLHTQHAECKVYYIEQHEKCTVSP